MTDKRRASAIHLLLASLAILFLVFSVAPAVAATSVPADNPNRIVSITPRARTAIASLQEVTGLHMDVWDVTSTHIVGRANDSAIQAIGGAGFTVEVLYETEEEYIASVQEADPQATYHYHSYDELETDLRQLRDNYPHVSELHVVGKSVEGRNLTAIRITGNLDQQKSKKILFNGLHHAREYISLEVPFLLAKYLVENYESDPRVQELLNQVEVWVLPLVNPDGLEYCRSSLLNRLWRKNRAQNSDGTFGVDLNRNYSYQWGLYDNVYNSKKPGSDTYIGPSPFSEPETRAVRDLVHEQHFDTVVSYHSFSELVLFPWGYTTSPVADTSDHRLMQTTSSKLARLINEVHGEKYVAKQSSRLYKTAGDQCDWVYGVYQVPAYTIELRPKSRLPGYRGGVTFGFILPESQIEPTWEENKPAALYLIEQVVSTPKTNPVFDAQYVGDANNVAVSPGQTFEVTLSFKNTGKVHWGSSRAHLMMRPGGTAMGAPASLTLESDEIVPINGTKTWTVELTAPSIPGLYWQGWQMFSETVGWFGDRAYVGVEVRQTLYAGASGPGVVYQHVAGTEWEAISPELGYAVLALVEYDGHLYAGTTSAFGADGIGRVYRYDSGTTWTLVGDNLDGNVCALAVYKGDLYAGTSWNGMKLYRYDGGTSWTRKVDGGWYGTRSLYVYGDYLLMGDVYLDYVGLWDGTTFHPVQPIGMGSCIYDFQEYGGSLYGAAYVGRLWHSPDGWSWTVALDSYRAGNMWALEEFRGELYMSYNNGELRASNVPDRGRLVYTAPDGIISMTTGGDHLYFGTGGDAVGYGAESTGIANVYQYDGSNVVLISDHDEFGVGVQVLYAG